MLRDPFDIHRKNAFRATATQVAQNIRNTAAQVGANAVEMSFNLPKNVPNFKDPYRELEDKAWQAMRNGGRMTGLIDGQELPMYKDKPYAYAPSYRNRPIWKKKRTWGITFLLFLLLHWLHWLPWQGPKPAKGQSAWKWMNLGSGKEVVDWNARREQVVEAFQESWDTYAANAWGKIYWTLQRRFRLT